MSVGYRAGSTSDVVSTRCQTIVVGSAAPAFVATKIRPKLVAAQTTLRSVGDRPMAEMRPPERSSPHGNGAVHATVHAPAGFAAVGHSAAGPYVRRPRCAGSPIAFQSSHTSIGRSYVPFSLMSPSPTHTLQCSFTFAYGKF